MAHKIGIREITYRTADMPETQGWSKQNSIYAHLPLMLDPYDISHVFRVEAGNSGEPPDQALMDGSARFVDVTDTRQNIHSFEVPLRIRDASGAKLN